MDGAPLVGGGPAREERRQVDRARLAVASDAEHGTGLRECFVDPRREHLGPGVARVGSEEAARDAEVHDEVAGAAQVEVEDARGVHAAEPGPKRGTLRERGQGARVAQQCRDEARVERVQLLERRPRGRLAHARVRVAAARARARRRHDDTHRQARRHERRHESDLRLLERQRGVVAGDDGGHRRERVFLSEQRVGRGDRRLGHQQPVMHVAEVEQAGHGAGKCPRVAQEHVVVVGVAVDHLAAQPRQRRCHLLPEARESACGEAAPRGIGDPLERRDEGECPRQVPGKLAARGRVREVGECPVQLPEQAPERGERLRRARPRSGEGLPRQPAEHADEPLAAVRPPQLAHRGAAPRLDDARQRQLRRARLEVDQHRALHRHERPLARGVHRLQDERAPVGGGEAEVVVELAGQRARPRVEPVERGRDPGRVAFAERALGAALGVHGSDNKLC